MQYNSGSHVYTKFGDCRLSAPTAGGTDNGEAVLGINTKSTSPYAPSKVPQAQYLRGLRANRYSLQNVIRKLVIAKSDFDPDNPDFEVYNKLPRVVKCKWVQVKPTVDIMHDKAENKAHYCNLTSCGSVWSCPVCAERIQEVRRQEIHQSVEWAKANGLQPVMVTLTTPHYEHQTCDELLKGLSKAHKNLVSGKRWVNFKKKIGFEGMIRSLETLYGDSGWHSHFHVLWFVSADTDLDDITKYVLDRWERACDKQGLIPRGKLRAFRKHSVKVQVARNSGEYLAKQDSEEYLVKWGVDKEIAKGLAKRSSTGLLHPFELAAAWGEHGIARAGELFMEYISAFKGKAQIFWSRGLKDKSGVNDVSDQEASEKESEEAEKVLSMENHAWGIVKTKNMRSQLLDFVETLGVRTVEDWLRENRVNSVLSYNLPRKGWSD